MDQSDSRMVTGVIAAVSGLFLLMGLGMMFNSGRIFYSGQQSESWPRVEGIVTRGEVKRRPSSKGFDRFQALVAYTYEVNGEKYRSETIFFGQRPGDEGPAKALVEKYKGPEVTVFYQPDDPAKAVLRPGVAWSQVALWGAAGIFLSLLGFGGLLGIRRWGSSAS